MRNSFKESRRCKCAFECPYPSGMLLPFSTDAEADLDRVVNRIHCHLIEVTHLFLQPLFVDRSDLLEQHNAVLAQPGLRATDVNVRRQLCFGELRGDCRERGRYTARGAVGSYPLYLHPQWAIPFRSPLRKKFRKLKL